MVVAQGVMVAPMIVWAEPLTHLLFGHAYGSASGAIRALAVFSFAAGPAWLMTRLVVRLDVVRSRLLATSVPLEAGLIATYLLTRPDGIVGAAIALDALVVMYLAAHLKVASSLIDLSRLRRTLGRTALAAIVMAVLLYGAGTRDLSAVGWVAGAIGGLAAFAAVLLVTGEVSLAQLTPPASGPRPGHARQ
jgi:O-antigen/teichoic acid export membrane protein